MDAITTKIMGVKLDGQSDESEEANDGGMDAATPPLVAPSGDTGSSSQRDLHLLESTQD